MTEANKIIEALGLENFFYKEMDIFFVKMPNNKVEKHYYLVDAKGVVQVYDSAKQNVKNPLIKKTQSISIDNSTKRMVYAWTFGSDYAIPLFSENAGEKFFLSDDEINAIFNRGAAWADLLHEKKEMEDKTPMLLVALVIIGLMVIASFYLDYRIADKMGIIENLFPKGS